MHRFLRPVTSRTACRLALVEHYADVACRAAALHAAQNGAAAAHVLDRAAPGVALAAEWAIEVRGIAGVGCAPTTMFPSWTGMQKGAAAFALAAVAAPSIQQLALAARLRHMAKETVCIDLPIFNDYMIEEGVIARARFVPGTRSTGSCVLHQGNAPPGSLGAYAALAGQAMPALAARMDAGLRQAFCEARPQRTSTPSYGL